MKKNKLFNRIAFAAVLSATVIACSDDDGGGSSVDFPAIASSYFEADGPGTVTVAVRNGSIAESDIAISGTATEGEDYTYSVTDEGVQFSILDDEDWELNETIIVRLLSAAGNSTHTVTIVSNCEDVTGVPLSTFKGVWRATEDYGESGTFGPYNVTFTQDATDPNKFTFPNFYGSGATYTAYLVFDTSNGTVRFPDQTVGAPANNRGPLTASTGTFDLCANTLTINLTYDGGPWIYRFTR